MINKLITTAILLLILVGNAEATWYVRSDGGTPTECTGTTDAAYPGSGTGQACALEHPFWVLGVHENCDVSAGRLYSGGDTIIIEDEAFMMGYGAPNTAGGASAFPWDCHMLPIVGGADSNNRTKIYGRNYASCSSISSATELYAVERSEAVIWTDASSDHADIRCFHITDHSNCKYQSSISNGDACDTGTYPFGDYGYKGIESTGTDDLRVDDVWITGMASEGASVDTPSNWELNRVYLWGNAGINWNFNGTGASGSTADAATGTMTFNDGVIMWAGCTLEYPATSSSYNGFTAYDPRACCSQDQGCAADGLGSEANGADWVFNGTTFMQNVADGLDLLYTTESGGSVTLNGAKFIDNSGNQLKASGTIEAYNIAIQGNCNFFSGKAYTYTGEEGFSDHCRASGNAIAIAMQSGSTAKFYGMTLKDATNAEAFLVVGRGSLGGSYTCTSGNTIDRKNSVITSVSGSLGFDSIDSSCTSSVRTQTQSVIYNFATNPTGTGNAYTDPSFTSGTVDNLTLSMHLSSTSSPAYNIADESASGQPSTDINDFDRGAAWDAGAVEYGSTGGGGGSSAAGLNTGGIRITGAVRIQ